MSNPLARLFRRTPRHLAGPDPARVPPHELLADQVIDACSRDLPSFTVVNEDAEDEYVRAFVAEHIDAIDEFTADLNDHTLAQRHHERIGAIEEQALNRHREATARYADVAALLAEVGLLSQQLRESEAQLSAEARRWGDILTGHRAHFEANQELTAAKPLVADAIVPTPPVAALEEGDAHAPTGDDPGWVYSPTAAA